MKTKQRFSMLLLVALLPISAEADVWQDPVTKVNYEYAVGTGEASVKVGTRNEAGSPDATGDIAILPMFTIDGKDYYVNSIGTCAFCKTNITSITIPEIVNSIGSCTNP